MLAGGDLGDCGDVFLSHALTHLQAEFAWEVSSGSQMPSRSSGYWLELSLWGPSLAAWLLTCNLHTLPVLSFVVPRNHLLCI